MIGAQVEYRDPDVVRRKVEAKQVRPTSYGPPRRLERTCAVDLDYRRGWPCYRVAPRTGAPGPDVLFVHGGAYIEEISAMHWRLIERLATALSARVTVPVYPLAPRGCAGSVAPEVTGLARELLERASGDVVLMGDSAGGGMVLAAAQRLRDEGGDQPDRLILISPWLDVTMRNPAIPEVEPRDPELSSPALRFAGGLWAHDLDPDDPVVSPINGTMAGLPPTTVFIGTHDVLNPDAHRFRALAEGDGVPVDFHEAPGQIHVYPLYRIPEGRRARDRIITAIRRSTP
ncbi:alpha/beta hydrolase fold domain-containing protein [Spinactinospora alkalitolerans]